MKRTLCIAVLLAVVTVGCSCPPVGGSGGRGSRDSSDVTFAFFGGLRCLFGENPNQNTTEESRQIAESDLTTKGEKKAATGPHTAALTIR